MPQSPGLWGAGEGTVGAQAERPSWAVLLWLWASLPISSGPATGDGGTAGTPCPATDALSVGLPPFAHSSSSGSLRSGVGVTCPGLLCSWTRGLWGQRLCCACCGPPPASRHDAGSTESSQGSAFAVSCDVQPRCSSPGRCLEAVSWGAVRREHVGLCPWGRRGVHGAAVGAGSPPTHCTGCARSCIREDPLRAHCCWRRSS